jgi:hypothetical protein
MLRNGIFGAIAVRVGVDAGAALSRIGYPPMGTSDLTARTGEITCL